MADYAVTVKIRNGRVLGRMAELGIETQAELARLAGASANEICAVVNMRKAAFTEDGRWRDIAIRVAGALRCDPGDLFNDQQRQCALTKNSAEVGMDAHQVAAIMTDSGERASWAKIEAQRLLGALPNDRMRSIVEARAAGATIDELAAEHGVSRERIRQIEIQGHLHMKRAVVLSNKDLARRLSLED